MKNIHKAQEHMADIKLRLNQDNRNHLLPSTSTQQTQNNKQRQILNGGTRTWSVVFSESRAERSAGGKPSNISVLTVRTRYQYTYLNIEAQIRLTIAKQIQTQLLIRVAQLLWRGRRKGKEEMTINFGRTVNNKGHFNLRIFRKFVQEDETTKISLKE